MTPKEAKQQQFVIEYCKDFNIQRASEACGHTLAWGTKQLKIPEVIAALTAFRERLMEANEISVDRVIEELKDIAFATKAEMKEAGVRMPDKLKAIEMIAKHLGMMSDKIDVNMKEEVVKKIIFEYRGEGHGGVLADPMNDPRSLDTGDDIRLLEAETR